MPRKVFVAGEILTAADVNTNLMDQAVMVFDDAAARTAAIPSPTEGMVTYLKDVDRLEQFTTVFEPVSKPGILQVVEGTLTAVFTASIATGATTTVTGLSATITPSSTSSKVLVLVNISGSSSSSKDGFSVIVKRGGTGIGLGDASSSRTPVTSGGASDPGSDTGGGPMNSSSPVILDSPASTSALTYTVDILNPSQATHTLMVNRSGNDGDAARSPRSSSRIVLMEVAG